MRRLTIKQQLFIKQYLLTNNGTEAAYKVYNCKNRATASQIAYENLRKHEIQKWMSSLFEANEFDIGLVIKSLVDIATKTKVTHIRASDSNRASELLLKLSGFL